MTTYLGKYKTRAPRMRNTNERVFEDTIIADVEGDALAAAFGYKVRKPNAGYAPCLWVYVPKFAEPHKDGGGLCIVYLHSGRGDLWINNKQTRMYKGDVVLFNDRREHFWLSHTPCKMLVVNVGRKKCS